MDWKKEWKPLLWIVAVFLALFYLPVGTLRFDRAITEALHLARWYAREHVILCLIPAFFIAGAIGVFIRQESVMKYLGPRANKALAYGVASVSGTILAVCSCTVLPLFAGIWRMGAGLGPASAFLYSGPAINVLAIILTARVLGMKLGIARAVAAVLFSIVIGLLMHFIFRKEETEKANAQMVMPEAGSRRGRCGRMACSFCRWWRSWCSPTGENRVKRADFLPPSTPSNGWSRASPHWGWPPFWSSGSICRVGKWPLPQSRPWFWLSSFPDSRCWRSGWA